MNRYARVNIDHRNNVVSIQRWGKFYTQFYSNITASSHARLKRIIDSMSLIKEGARYSAYEWQPTSPKYHYQCLECKSIVLSDDTWLSIGCYDCDTYQGMPMRLVEKHNVK